jgi:hypothetical protein
MGKEHVIAVNGTGGLEHIGETMTMMAKMKM